MLLEKNIILANYKLVHNKQFFSKPDAKPNHNTYASTQKHINVHYINAYETLAHTCKCSHE